jgi:hypothetical protein
VGTPYTSEAFREYAKAQVAYADVLLIKRAESALRLCRCGRLHPCEERQHWLRMRAHFTQLLGRAVPAGAITRD